MVKENTSESKPTESREAASHACGWKATSDEGGQVLGAPPSNTAPVKYIADQKTVNILRSGVDSLYLTFRGRLKKAVCERLAELKLLARSDDPTDSSQAVYEVGNHCFEVRANGRGRFPYLLVDAWFELALSQRGTTNLPMAHIKIRSEVLSRGKLQSVLQSVTAAVGELGVIEGTVANSRLDLCIDFTTGLDFSAIPRACWVTRAHHFAQYHANGIYTGCTFGQGGDMSCRLYNKTIEVAKTGKHYIFPLWKEAGWDGLSTVWRLEFQYKRPVLKECGTVNAGDLPERLEGLWKYAMGWLRLTVPNSDTNKSRWPDHFAWCILRNHQWGQSPTEPLFRVTKCRIPDESTLFVNSLGGLTSFMAKEGIDDFDQGVMAYLQGAADYHLKLSPLTKRPLRCYVTQ